MTGKSRNTQPGVSIYPIRPGAIFKLHPTKMKYNKIVGRKIQYHVYIWITGITKKEIHKKWRDRPVRFVRFEVPVEDENRHFYIEPDRREVRFENACRLFNKGFDDLGEVAFQYNKTSWRKFYKAIGYH